MFAPDRHYLYVGSMVAIPLGLVLCALILSPDDLGLRAGQLAGLKGSGPAERRRGPAATGSTGSARPSAGAARRRTGWRGSWRKGG